MTAVERPTALSAGQAAAVRRLAAQVAAEDGREPLSDQALTQLTSDRVRHVVAGDGDTLRGYGQLDAEGGAELVARRDGVREMLEALLDERPSLRVWSHGTRSRLEPELEARGARAERRLFQLRRPLTGPVPEPTPPDGVALSEFAVGRDETDWLAVNAAAFASHPEQGDWTIDDLRAREQEPWFDPAGFFLARRGGRLVGFHWTKVHPDGLGEVYVIAVDPSEQGSGLGTVLLLKGIAHLQRRGCPAVMLYVDESNAGAMRLYERSGFSRYDVDVQWSLTR